MTPITSMAFAKRMKESDWDHFLDVLVKATEQAVNDFATQNPDKEVCYFAFDSEPRYGYVLLCFDTSRHSSKHAVEWHDRHVQTRQKQLADPDSSEGAYWQVKFHAVLPFCNNTGDFEFQGFSEVRFPEWEAFADSPDYPSVEDEEDDYLANRAARLFSRAVDRLVERSAFRKLRLATPAFLGFGFHDDDMVILHILNLPRAAQPEASPPRALSIRESQRGRHR